jgi:hypothetical protein
MTKINNKHHKNKSYTNFADDFEHKLTKAIEQGIINALKAFGADMDNQGEVQKDFHFLRYMRKRSEATGHIILKVVISIIIGSSAVAIWEGIKAAKFL